MIRFAPSSIPIRLLVLSAILFASVPGIAADTVTDSRPLPLPERCRKSPPEKGECKALFSVFYFNADTNKCQESLYGGCGGDVPFDTEEECRQLCETGERLRLAGISPREDHQGFLVEVEYPPVWGEPQLVLAIDGVIIPYQPAPAVISTGSVTRALTFTVSVPGVKTVEVSTVVGSARHRVFTRRYLEASPKPAPPAP